MRTALDQGMATHAAGETGHTQQGCGLVVADSGDGGGGSGTAMETTLSQSTGARARQWRQCCHRAQLGTIDLV